MEVKTIDALNSGSVNLICSERDEMKLGGVLRSHPLLFHFNRALWPALFATLQLKKMTPIDYDYYDKSHYICSMYYVITSRVLEIEASS